MAFTCQRNSYLQSIDTIVLSCIEAEFVYNVYGKKKKARGYAITLEDSVLFPEGGGQPFDCGKINNIDVIAVLRQGEKAIHYTTQSASVGEAVTVTVDWKRRFAHMQQHSGQHLITAVAQKNYSFETTAWNLGEKISSIELDTASMVATEMKEIEGEVNRLIRECIPVQVKTVNKDEISDMDITIDSKELPSDAAGPIRIVSIEGIDNNLCCGTHVKNTSELQMIKLLGFEKGKKGKTLLNFIAGNRVLEHLDTEIAKQKELTKLLSCGAEEHVPIVQKLHKQSKELNKSVKMLLKNLALKEVELLQFKLEQSLLEDKLFVLHNPYGNLDFMNVLSQEIESVDPEILVFLTVDSENGKGLFLMSGAKNIISQSVINKILELLDGKGVLKNGRCHGKANNMKHLQEVANYLKDIIHSRGLNK